MQKIKIFIKESAAEFKKVTWPDFQILKRSTIAVIVLMVLMALYFGIVDVIFSKMLHIYAR
ncbi:MAG: preprotein translocase subunit SecE [Candidatus Omnitrophica bacterium]|nr:preprotein translocase subunit SecE [Candidatus Omnitrophota bacterium]MCM8816263.1 preprotein translocase subunit SecE [Candidatus Omnitrophota bacterium]